MTISDPEHRFRVVILLWAGNYRGEQPFYSAAQNNLENAITLLRQIQANAALNSQIRSYVIHEQIGKGEWETLDYSDWRDL